MPAKVAPDIVTITAQPPAVISTLSQGTALNRQLAGGGAWAIAGRAGLALTGLMVNALITRLLVPKDVGTYFLVVSALGTLVVILQLGLQHAVVKLTAEALGAGDAALARGVIVLVMGVGCGIAAVACLTAGLGAHFVGQAWSEGYLARGAVALLGIWAFARTAEGLASESFRGLHDIRSATVLNVLLGNLLLVTFLAGLWFTGDASLWKVLLLSVIASALAAIAGCVLLLKRLSVGPIATPKFMRVMQVAAPMLVTSLMLIIISQADLWIVANYLSENEVAIYGASVRLVQLVMIPMLIVNAVLPPFIASLYREERLGELERIVRLAAAAGFVPGLCILAVFSVFGPTILEALYGPFYGAGAQLLILVSAGQVVNGLAGGGAMVLMMTGHQFSLMCISIFCGLALIAGGIASVNSFGVVGVAAATGLSIALHGILSLLWAKRKTGIWTCFGGLGPVFRAFPRFRS